MLTRNFIEILKIKGRNFKNRAGLKKSIHNVWLFWDGRDYYFLNVFVKCMNIKSGSVDYLYIIITRFFYFFFLFNLYISIHKLWTKKLKSFMMLSSSQSAAKYTSDLWYYFHFKWWAAHILHVVNACCTLKSSSLKLYQSRHNQELHITNSTRTQPMPGSKCHTGTQA